MVNIVLGVFNKGYPLLTLSESHICHIKLFSQVKNDPKLQRKKLKTRTINLDPFFFKK